MDTLQDFEYRVGTLSLSPGDVLVVKLVRRPSAEEAHRIRGCVGKVVGEGVPVLILDRDADLSVLTKAEIDARVKD